MTIQEIVIELRDNFALEFSANEILSIIKGDEKTFVIKHKNSDQILNKYDLSIFAYTKACERSSGVSLTQIINDFLSTKMQDISVEQAEDLILRFLFIEFNEDTENLLNYMNKSISFPIPDENFSDEEKTFIDSFLSWDNKNKNRLIFNALSSSIDYCMITAQRDTRLIKDMFFNKTFYLDTNIIFRLAGINKQERQINAEAFIKKCKSLIPNWKNTPTTTRFRQRLCKSRIMGQKKSGVRRWKIFSAIENIVLKIMSYHMALAITMDTPHMSLLMIWHNIILKNAYILRHSLRRLNIQY